MCPARGLGWWAGFTLPREQAIKCAAWASRPLVSGPGLYMGISKNDAPGQNRKKTHFGTEVLLERKRRQEVKGVKRYTVLT